MSVVGVFDATTSNAIGIVSDVQRTLADRYTNFELVVVDNGLATAQVVALREELRTLSCVRVIRLSRRFDYETALFSGLDTAIGDFIVLFDPSLDPVAEIPLVVARVQSADIVQGVSVVPLTRGARAWGKALFYWYNSKILGIRIPAQSTYLTGFTRRAANTLLSARRRHRYLRHLIRHVGFEVVEFDYSPQTPSGENTSAGRKRPGSDFREAVEMITSYSLAPLRLVATTGVIVALANLGYAGYVILTYLLADGVERGWATTNLQLGIMFFFTFLSLAVVSEYIGRLLSEARNEPAYYLMEEIVSDQLIADETRRNVA
ncbi:glycosyltransferase [Demequina sediminis]|uniref:glycosyltransferase n=1 Tax=Demequina sediminis TaxID=1930058 RepID=UPI0025742943|nr:glycosyltransferase [Demequina sediminis]